MTSKNLPKQISDAEVARVPGDQLLLFPSFPTEQQEALQQLFQQGVLSFDPSEVSTWTQSLSSEVAFFSSLLDDGIDLQSIIRFAHRLEAPYQYDPHNLVYSFAKQKWFGLEALPAKKTAEAALQEALSMAVRENDISFIQRILNQTLQALNKVAESLEEEVGERTDGLNRNS